MKGRQELDAEAFRCFTQRLTRRLRIKVGGLTAGDGSEPYPFARHLEQLPDLVELAAELVVDDRLPVAQRRLLLAAVLYVMNPGDLLPESIVGPVGMTDDLVVVAGALEAVLAGGGAEVVCGLWRGERDLAEVIRGVAADGEAMVGPTVWSRLPDWAG